MTKVARTFTIDQEVYMRAKQALPNMSQVVENGLRDAIAGLEDTGDEPNPLRGVSRKLLNKAAAMIGQQPINARVRAERWALKINQNCGTHIQPEHLINYAQATELVR